MTYSEFKKKFFGQPAEPKKEAPAGKPAADGAGKVDKPAKDARKRT